MITREQFRRALVGSSLGALVGHTLGFFVLWPLGAAVSIPLLSAYCGWLLHAGFWLSGAFSLLAFALLGLAEYRLLDSLWREHMGVPLVR